MVTDFEDIRPYNDSEVPQVIARLVKEDGFIRFAQQLLPSLTKEQLQERLLSLKTIDDFQGKFIAHLGNHIINSTTDGLTIDGLDKLDPKQSYLFISDHRDIILDSALLNMLLVKNNFSTTEIAIGSNLLIQPWIEDLVKLNKSFVVKRNVSVREMLMSSKKLSAYINYALNTKKSSIWIAQREGRTKDGNDKTQHSLLKMLQMNGRNDFSNYLKNLRIVPVAISYEYEPCDALKSAEICKRNTDEGFQKTAKDDLRSMIKGMVNPKGRIHFSIGKPISEMLDVIEEMDDSRDKIKALAELIDYRIHKHFKLWPDNYIAYDMIHNTNRFEKEYTDEEKKVFLKHMRVKLSNVATHDNMEQLETIFLEIYANPVKNRLDLVKPDFIK